MMHIGMDWHPRQTDFVVRNANGRKLFSRHVQGGIGKVMGELEKIDKPFSVTFEASTGYGHVFDELSKVANTVKVAHPGHLRLIFRSKRKSDRIDADKLSKLDYLGEVPLVHVPKTEVRSWRATIKYRNRMVSERTGAKNQIRAFLRTHGITAPRGLWAKKGIQWIRSLEFADELDALQRDELVERLCYMNELVKRVTKALDRKARRNPAVGLLRTIPGIGPRTAEAVVAWIDQIVRFDSVRQVGAYFGLVPCLDSSAGTDRYGHITREGPSVVRRLVVEAAHQGVRRSTRIRAFYDRVCRSDPGRKKIAIVATAHYLVRVMAAMLRTGEPWRAEA